MFPYERCRFDTCYDIAPFSITEMDVATGAATANVAPQMIKSFFVSFFTKKEKKRGTKKREEKKESY